MTVSERVYEVLKAQKHTQVELAEYLGASTSSVGYWFNKGGDIPSRFLLPICQFLNITTNYLLTGVPDPVIDTTPTADSLSEDEQELVRTYRLLDREGRIMVMATAYSHKSRLFGSGGDRAGTEAV